MNDTGKMDDLLSLLVELRQTFGDNKNWKMSDLISSKLEKFGIILEDKANGTKWKNTS